MVAYLGLVLGLLYSRVASSVRVRISMDGDRDIIINIKRVFTQNAESKLHLKSGSDNVSYFLRDFAQIEFRIAYEWVH